MSATILLRYETGRINTVSCISVGALCLICEEDVSLDAPFQAVAVVCCRSVYYRNWSMFNAGACSMRWRVRKKTYPIYLFHLEDVYAQSKRAPIASIYILRV